MTSELFSEAPLQETIVPRLGELSPALRSAADFVLNNPDSVAMQSLRRIAKDNDLAPATFSRLARSLGLDSYEGLRDLCRREVRQRSRSFADKVETLQRSAARGEGSFFKKHAASSIASIDDLVASIDSKQLVDTAAKLTQARQVLLVGALSSAPLIDYLGYSARMALPNWRTAVRNHSSIAMDLPDIGQQDVVLVLAHKPYARAAVDAARAAQQRGAHVVSLTDSYAAPVADFADDILVLATDGPHFFASGVATVVLLEVLLSMVVQRTGKKAHRRIEVIENENHRLGEYWQR